IIIYIFGFIPGVMSFLIKALWSKRNTHNTELLSQYIEQNCNNYKNIVLVAHSMGGIIARQYLVECRKNQVDIRKFKMLVTYATPHKGSHIAKFLSIKNIPFINTIYLKISKVFNYRLSPQIGDLSSFSEFIDDLDKDWRDFNIESYIKFLRITANYDSVVKKESAQLHLEDIENVYDYDYSHSSLIKPNKKDTLFPPIDKFIEQLGKIDFETEDYYEELEEEINYDLLDADDY
uniref:lipase family alpha/beta hydrolase n=1 Tax=Mesoflavibacter zeaxanthinifaciens TaxID=393060 RepID=UPI003A8D3980